MKQFVVVSLVWALTSCLVSAQTIESYILAGCTTKLLDGLLKAKVDSDCVSFMTATTKADCPDPSFNASTCIEPMTTVVSSLAKAGCFCITQQMKDAAPPASTVCGKEVITGLKAAAIDLTPATAPFCSAVAAPTPAPGGVTTRGGNFGAAPAPGDKCAPLLADFVDEMLTEKTCAALADPATCVAKDIKGCSTAIAGLKTFTAYVKESCFCSADEMTFTDDLNTAIVAAAGATTTPTPAPTPTVSPTPTPAPVPAPTVAAPPPTTVAAPAPAPTGNKGLPPVTVAPTPGPGIETPGVVSAGPGGDFLAPTTGGPVEGPTTVSLGQDGALAPTGGKVIGESPSNGPGRRRSLLQGVTCAEQLLADLDKDAAVTKLRVKACPGDKGLVAPAPAPKSPPSRGVDFEPSPGPAPVEVPSPAGGLEAEGPVGGRGSPSPPPDQTEGAGALRMVMGSFLVALLAALALM